MKGLALKLTEPKAFYWNISQKNNLLCFTHLARSLVSLEDKWTGLTENFTDHENQADDGGQAQALPGNFLFALSILLCMAVVVAVLDGDSGAVQCCLHAVGSPAARI